MQFKALIQGLCERLGLRYADDTLTDNEFVLQADNTQVRLQARGPLLQLITQLGAIPTSDSEKKKAVRTFIGAIWRGGLALRGCGCVGSGYKPYSSIPTFSNACAFDT